MPSTKSNHWQEWIPNPDSWIGAENRVMKMVTCLGHCLPIMHSFFYLSSLEGFWWYFPPWKPNAAFWLFLYGSCNFLSALESSLEMDGHHGRQRWVEKSYKHTNPNCFVWGRLIAWMIHFVNLIECFYFKVQSFFFPPNDKRFNTINLGFKKLFTS